MLPCPVGLLVGEHQRSVGGPLRQDGRTQPGPIESSAPDRELSAKLAREPVAEVLELLHASVQTLVTFGAADEERAMLDLDGAAVLRPEDLRPEGELDPRQIAECMAVRHPPERRHEARLDSLGEHRDGALSSPGEAHPRSVHPPIDADGGWPQRRVVRKRAHPRTIPSSQNRTWARSCTCRGSARRTTWRSTRSRGVPRSRATSAST